MRKIVTAGLATSVVAVIVNCNALLGNDPFTLGVPEAGPDAGDANITTDATDATDGPSHSDTGPPGTCTPGGTCATDCETGEYVCLDGGQTCNATTQVANGTPCGTGSDHVCNSGVCIACAAGSSCNDPALPCVTKNNDCSSGSAVCKATGNVADGTSCNGTNYCYGGVCSPCTIGASCTPAANACHVGKVTSCANGVATCTDQGTNAATGTTCTTSSNQSGVCVAGVCEACTPNAQCNPNGNVCQNGTMSCSAGPSCTFTGNAPNGTSCGSGGQICVGGTCEQPCGPSNCPNGCCGANNACVPYAGQSNGTCGNGGATCGACTSPLVCSSSGTCACPAGQALCGASCVTLATDNNNCGFCGHACGAGATCTSGYCPPVAVCTGGGANAGNAAQISKLGPIIYIQNLKSVLSCNVSTTGAAPTTFWQTSLTGLSVTNLMADSQILYWGVHDGSRNPNYNYLYGADGAVITLEDTYPTAWASTYVRSDVDPSTGQVVASTQTTVSLIELSQTTDAGVPVYTCMSSLGNLTDAVAGGGKIFATDGASNSVVGTVVTGGACSSSSTVATGLSSPGSLATNGGKVVFADSNGVYACDTALGCVPQSNPTPLVANQGPVKSIVLDAASPPNLYWVGSSGLMKCSSDANICNGKPTLLLPNVTPTAGMAADATYVYYLQGNVLSRVAK